MVSELTSREWMIEDLGRSGLEMQDMHSRPVGPPELQMCNAGAHDGYVIPYHGLGGDLLPFYRLRLLSSEIKYKQPTQSPNHVYFPLGLYQCVQKHVETSDNPVIILTEGEKKAAACVKAGIPAAAFGGVDSWRNRTLIFPDDTELKQGVWKQRGVLYAKLPAGSSGFVGESHTLAAGMTDLIDLIRGEIPLTAIICYDTDLPTGGLKPTVQRAAAFLGYELKYSGVPFTSIRQLILPPGGKGKMGLDDYLLERGADGLNKLIGSLLGRRNAFPRHPSPKEFLNRQLQSMRSRKELQNISLSILCELDARGRRLKEVGTGEPYFFDGRRKHLVPAKVQQRTGDPFHETPFGQFLYKEYGLTAGDQPILNWLASQFTGESPVEDVQPLRVCSLHPTAPINILHQLNDHQYCIITPEPAKPLIICDNGANKVLFEQRQVEPVDSKELDRHFTDINSRSEFRSYWSEVLANSNIELLGKGKQNTDLFALLCYCSPWLNRWRGTQLPIEILIGAAGSGKSSIYELRLSVLTGRPSLRNMAQDLRDWYASITNAGGLHVTDNVHFTNRDMRQRLSDELCRITTEPAPHVELRRLYTTAGQWRTPVNVSFAMTGIEQPFPNTDLIQRAAILKVSTLKSTYDGNWVENQLRRHGGRARWLAHHFVALHRFLKAVVYDGAWDTEYRATHRLAHYEQTLMVMGDIVGVNTDNIGETLTSGLARVLVESDWTLEGLKEYATVSAGRKFGTKEIAFWAQASENFEGDPTLTNSRKLARYMAAHTQQIKDICGIVEVGKDSNRTVYTSVAVEDNGQK